MSGRTVYTYVGNDPLDRTDPSGNDAYVERDKDKITITMPIKYTGAADSKPAEQSFKKAVESKLSGKFGKYDVSTKVVAAKDGDAHTNTVSFDKKGPDTPSEVAGGKEMSLNTESKGLKWNERQHEAGHLTGMKDHYSDNGKSGAERVTAPESGWRGNIMGELPGNFGQKNIDEVLNSPNNVITNK